MKKFQIKNGWIIKKPNPDKNWEFDSMKLSEVCGIYTYYSDTFTSPKFLHLNGYRIRLGSSMPDYFEIEYLNNELEELNNDLKDLQELIFKLN